MNVYDFDKTIYAGDSSLDFWFFSIKKHPILLLKIPYQVFYFCLYKIGRCDKTLMKEKFFCFSISNKHIEKDIKLFWQKHEHKIYNWYTNQKNSNDIIISASPSFLLNPICQKLGVTLIATEIDLTTGVLKGLNCYGTEKLKRYCELYGTQQIDAFYSDSDSDKALAAKAICAYKVKNGRIQPWIV